MTSDVGKLQPVKLREIWPHEEKDFTTWLARNIEVLGEALGVGLSDARREQAVGPFSVDLTATDDYGRPVVIENQLGPSDHDHLGKLLTYMTNRDAKTAVWVAADARAEHVAAVNWFNQMSSEYSFYLVEIAAVRIGDSPPAPLFTVMAAPTEVGRGMGRLKEEFAESQQLRLRFWDGLLGLAKKKGLPLHAGRSPSSDNWIVASAGKSGLGYTYVLRLRKPPMVQLDINTEDPVQNKRIFDHLSSKKDHIEKEFGGSLQWDRLDDRRISKVRFKVGMESLESGEDRWPAMQEALVEAMARLHKAFDPHVRSLG